MNSRPIERVFLLGLGMIALMAGLWVGLVRLGWALPAIRPALEASHGPLLVSGFLGTLIGLERAVALGRRWTYAAPLLTGLGALATLLGLPEPVGPALMTLGSLGLVAIFILITKLQPAPFTATMGLGALAWLTGNVLWLAGRSLYTVVPWWAGFLVFTVAGERLEIGRLLRPSATARAAFSGAVVLLLAGLALSIAAFDAGVRLSGVAWVGLAIWLLRYDVAWRTIGQRGLPRFIAASLLPGYVWLGVGGILLAIFGGVMAGPRYDAVLHALFLGFVFSMIFGHAPLIFPAILRRAVTFHQSFYAHLALLHLSLLLRVGGDLVGLLSMRQWGGLFNVLAILLFLVNTVRAVLKSTAKV